MQELVVRARSVAPSTSGSVAQGGQRAQVVGSQFDEFRSVGSAAYGSDFCVTDSTVDDVW